MEFKKQPEGVVAASAVQSPGGSNVEQAPEVATTAQQTPPARQNLVVNMVDDFGASGRGRRARSPKIIEEKAASGGNKRKRAACEDGPFTTSPRAFKKRAIGRDIFAIPAAPGRRASPDIISKRATRAAFRPASTPTPAQRKRKRAGNDQEANITVPPSAKRGTTSRAAFTADLVTAAWEFSGTPPAAPPVPFPRPATETSSPGITASATPLPSTPEVEATNNVDSLAAGSTSGAQSTAIITRFAYPGSEPIFFLPGFSTPLFAAVAPMPAPAPMLGAPLAPVRTLLPSPIFTGPMTPVPSGLGMLLENFHIYEDEDEAN